MGRAPCCEKTGLKKGPWTPDEDQILISYIQKFGHGNWRALPKEAGLLRCGKSCRLRWINYLRPDIKRGNFTKDEEDAIIHLHQILGNKWSAIAMRLPGRTDNEIKNVWNTHLKKRLDPNQNLQKKCKRAARKDESSAMKTCFELVSESNSSDFSFEESSSNVTEENSSINANGNDESMESRWDDGADEIEESFWIEALHMNSNDSSPLMKAESGSEDDVSFWLRVFAEAGDLQGLPDI